MKPHLLLSLSILVACGTDRAGAIDTDVGSGEGGSDASSGTPSTVGPTAGSRSGSTGSPESTGSTESTAESTGAVDSTSTTDASTCGDGVVDDGEACDDGQASELCDAQCAWIPGVVRWSAALPGMFARDCAVDEAVLVVGGSRDPALDPDGATVAVVRQLDTEGAELSDHLLHDGPMDGEVNRLALTDDGRVMAVGEFGTFSPAEVRGRVWAASAGDLDPLWAQEVGPTGGGFSVADAVAVGGDRVVVASWRFGAANVDLFSVDGTPLWTAQPTSWSFVDGVVVLGDGGVIFVGASETGDGVARLDPEGAEVWSLGPQTLSERPSSIVLDADRVLIAGGLEAGYLAEVSLDGEVAWEKPAGPPNIEAVVLGASGRLISLAADDTGLQLRATDAEALTEDEQRLGRETPLWTHVVEATGDGPVTGGLALGPGQAVYVCGTVGGDPASVVVSLSE